MPCKRPIGGGDDAHVHLDGLRAADPFEGAFLQDAQQLGLHGGGHVADFVEEDRAAVGHLESAAPLADGAGEGALFMAEQLAFQQGFRQGRTVDGHERPGALLGGGVDGPGHLLLAGAGLALDEHRRIGAGPRW